MIAKKKKAICEEEDCSTRTNELVEEGGHLRSTNKFVKKIVRKEGCSWGRLFARKKATLCEGRRRFVTKKVVR